MKMLFFALWFVVLQTALAQGRLTPAELTLKQAADDCLSRISNGKYEDAFNTLLKLYWVDRDNYRQAAASMERQYLQIADRAEDRMGNPIPGGYDFVGVRRLGTSFTRLIYLQKNERFFIPWAFSFYKASGGWKLTRISFPDITEDEIKDFIEIVPAASSGD